jgi:hypothetical protein
MDPFGTLANELMRGEKVTWQGRPDASRLLTRADLYRIPFSLLWLGFVVFWEAGVLGLLDHTRNRAPVWFALWGIPFIAVGLYMVFGRFWVRRVRRRHTTYAVTDRRVLSIVEGRFRTTRNAQFIDRIPTINVAARGDGSGTVVFGNESIWSAAASEEFSPWGSRRIGGSAPVVFIDIEHAQRIADMVRGRRDDLNESARNESDVNGLGRD